MTMKKQIKNVLMSYLVSGPSLLLIALIVIRPSPGQENTCSTIT